jgi:hypothetical protein
VSRSINTYLAPSAPLAGTARFRRTAVYTRCLRCAGAPRRPTVVPCFPCAFRLDMPPSTTPGSSPAAHAQLLDRRRWPSHDPNCSALPTSPQSAPRGPVISGLHRFALAAACRLACLPGGSDRETLPADGDVYTRASDESVTLPVAEYDYDGSWAASIGGTSTRRNSS